MGTRSVSTCDGCGGLIVSATLQDSVQITAIGTDGLPRTFLLCVKPEFKDPKTVEERDAMENQPRVPKVTGCARKVLTKSVLGNLYREVAEYTGDENAKPFML